MGTGGAGARMSRRTLKSIADLAAAGLIPADAHAGLAAVAARYAVAITPDIAALIERSTEPDPIARQFVLSLAELETTPDETADPIGDHAHAPVKGLVHRYHDRVLLKATHTCPVYCRFCFRREMVGPDGDGTLTAGEIDTALAYVAARPEIREVIVTGGDPFLLSPRRIGAMTAKIAAVATVRTIRWHTRVPMVQPGAITPALVAALTGPAAGRIVRVAVHANHAAEFSAPASAALARLSTAGVRLLSQSVLLRGVNDSVAALAALMRAYAQCGVAPYYLHHGDLAPGTGHFRVPMAEGLALTAGLREALGPTGTPAYVVDLPGGHGKVPVASGVALPDGRMRFIDRNGRTHVYPPRRTQTEKAAAVAS